MYKRLSSVTHPIGQEGEKKAKIIKYIKGEKGVGVTMTGMMLSRCRVDDDGIGGGRKSSKVGAQHGLNVV